MIMHLKNKGGCTHGAQCVFQLTYCKTFTPQNFGDAEILSNVIMSKTNCSE